MSQRMIAAWGFGNIVTVSPMTGNELEVSEVMEALNVQARDRGINPGKPSDALDASRDIIITDAMPARYEWKLNNHTLFVYPANALSPADLAGIIARNS